MYLKELENLINNVEEDSLKEYIYPAKAKGISPILKILLTNKCKNNCKYCLNNARSNCPRYFLSPSDLSKQFISLYRKNLAKGIFISSGIYKNANFSQEKILETLYILRKNLNYSGYIHAKILPKTDFSLIEKIFDFADRISINLEYPAQKYLSRVSSKELFDDLFKRLKFLSRLNKEKKIKSGITTQFIVGGQKICDREYLNLAYYLYKELKLKRIYYSRFIPQEGTPLENLKEESPLRIKRLYEADFLLRDYGISPSQFLYDKEGNLVLEYDVKEAFALKNKNLFPVDVNKACFELLIKIPGIGKERAKRIINLRKGAKINSFEKLEKIGIPKKVKKWIKF
ncbi:MAG: hypothetical protein DRN05_06525 [Thermoplasmata archaeon]|nr:MAG: hypothetical protein DRN05_06525 [Thermoplasmata archaeon]